MIVPGARLRKGPLIVCAAHCGAGRCFIAAHLLQMLLSLPLLPSAAYEHSRQTFIAAGLRDGVPLPLIGVSATVPAEVRIDSLEPYVTDPARDPHRYPPCGALLLPAAARFLRQGGGTILRDRDDGADHQPVPDRGDG
jgi:hypothetical protein